MLNAYLVSELAGSLLLTNMSIELRLQPLDNVDALFVYIPSWYLVHKMAHLGSGYDL